MMCKKGNPKVVWKQIQHDKIRQIALRVPKERNVFVSLKAEDFPELNVAPQSYKDKLLSVDVAVSGCPSEDATYYMCNFRRFDTNLNDSYIDQDVFGFIIDNDTQCPSISGCMVYHGNWDGRTEELQPLPSGTPEQLFDALKQAYTPTSGDLSQLTESELRAFECINSVLQNEKKINPNFIYEYH